MDANGTRYHLLQGGDWGRCTRDSAGNESLATFWAPGADLTQVKLVLEGQPPALALQPEVFQFVPAERDSPPTLDQRRGAARDINGNWYWIGPGGDEILVLSSGSGVTTSFWSAREIVCDPAPQDAFVPLAAPAPPSRLRLAGLAVTEDQYLVVGLLEPASLLVFDLFAGGPRTNGSCHPRSEVRARTLHRPTFGG